MPPPTPPMTAANLAPSASADQNQTTSQPAAANVQNNSNNNHTTAQQKALAIVKHPSSTPIEESKGPAANGGNNLLGLPETPITPYGRIRQLMTPRCSQESQNKASMLFPNNEEASITK